MRSSLSANTISRREGRRSSPSGTTRSHPDRASKRSPPPGTTKGFQSSSVQLLSRPCETHELASLGSLLHGVEATQRLDVIGRRDHRSLIAAHDTRRSQGSTTRSRERRRPLRSQNLGDDTPGRRSRCCSNKLFDRTMGRHVSAFAYFLDVLLG